MATAFMHLEIHIYLNPRKYQCKPKQFKFAVAIVTYFDLQLKGGIVAMVTYKINFDDSFSYLKGLSC